ncbi:MAG: dTDP-4-dehydrorhamnose 3,5-epimerase [Parachlamydiaceae bacterium]
MQLVNTEIPDVLIIEPKIFGDDRGFFYESFNQKEFAEIAGIHDAFVQDNHSRSARNVLRGLHYQLIQPQGKLVRVVHGEIYDVAVDIRVNSPTFGKWVGANLSAANKRMFWVPKGFAHGFVVLSDFAEVLYKATDFYHPASEKSLCWNDPDLNISWPIDTHPSLSTKDSQGFSLKTAELFP